MTHVSSASDIQLVAANWLLDIGEDPSVETSSIFRTWLEADTRHRAQFLRLRYGWRKFNLLKEQLPLFT